MTSNAIESLWYVYGIVPAQAAVGSSAPAGLDDASVAFELHDDVAALVSVLQGPEYEPARLEAHSGDLEWLSPRAVAHDRVLTWASDRGAVVPLPMFSLFSGRDAVRAMLRERHEQVAGVLERVGSAREYALRVYRLDAELLNVVAELSPRLQELAATARSATPGQRYLLERKLEQDKKSELRGVTQQLIDEIVDALAPHARPNGVVRSAIPRANAGAAVNAADAGGDRGTMVLNAAFLIDPRHFADFQRTLANLIDRHTRHGLRFDFTGPWPPYHFVSETADDA